MVSFVFVFGVCEQADMVSMLRESKKIALAVGDGNTAPCSLSNYRVSLSAPSHSYILMNCTGGNDVAMIQKANIGV